MPSSGRHTWHVSWPRPPNARMGPMPRYQPPGASGLAMNAMRTRSSPFPLVTMRQKSRCETTTPVLLHPLVQSIDSEQGGAMEGDRLAYEIRRTIVDESMRAGVGHIGSALAIPHPLRAPHAAGRRGGGGRAGGRS